MADVTRAEELVQTLDRDPAFQENVKAAPTVEAKRSVLESHGFGDVSLDDMKAYVESKGGTLVMEPGGRELSEQELAAVAGGTDAGLIAGGVVGGVIGIGLVAGVVAAFAA
jgi:predicted ribosomally synthesized peptide with nif11-like leader